MAFAHPRKREVSISLNCRSGSCSGRITRHSEKANVPGPTERTSVRENVLLFGDHKHVLIWAII